MDYKQDSFSALNISHNCLNLFHSSWEFTWDAERHQILSSVTLTSLLTDVETFKYGSSVTQLLGDCGCMCPRGGAVVLFKWRTGRVSAALSLHALWFTSSSSSCSMSHNAHMSLWNIYSVESALIYYYQILDVLNNSIQSVWPCPCHSWSHLHNHHGLRREYSNNTSCINITLRSEKIKSNPSLQRLSARPRCLPVSHINSVSPSLTGRRRSYLPESECEILLLQGGLSLSWEPGEGVYWAVRVGMTALANNGTVGFAQAARWCVRDQKTLSLFCSHLLKWINLCGMQQDTERCTTLGSVRGFISTGKVR